MVEINRQDIVSEKGHSNLVRHLYKIAGRLKHFLPCKCDIRKMLDFVW